MQELSREIFLLAVHTLFTKVPPKPETQNQDKIRWSRNPGTWNTSRDWKPETWNPKPETRNSTRPGSLVSENLIPENLIPENLIPEDLIPENREAGEPDLAAQVLQEPPPRVEVHLEPQQEHRGQITKKKMS
jgi:hypothetical protein